VTAPVTIDDMIEELRRELVERARMLPIWKRNSGSARRNMLDRRHDILAAIVDHLEEERRNGRSAVARE
jgi:hypothetical protein